jgi:alkaline phosphatase D
MLATPAVAHPYLSRASGRPVITHGVQSGDVCGDSGMVWSRADRPARMLVEVATTDSFRDIRKAVCVDALPETDFTAKALLENLPAGQDIFYRISFRPCDPGSVSELQIGRFRTAPSDRRSLSFVWSGDTAAGLGHRFGARSACAATPLCARAGRISSSTRATASTPIARSS